MHMLYMVSNNHYLEIRVWRRVIVHDYDVAGFLILIHLDPQSDEHGGMHMI
jgi:hypothetical protein